MNTQSTVEIHPVTRERWGDMQALFGRNGACSGCWCMFWRLPSSQFEKQRGEGTRLAMQALIEGGETPGLLAYWKSQEGATPAGWVCVAPRSSFPRLQTSRILKPIDDQPVWSIVCFYTARKFRRQGLALQLIEAAVEYARQNGAHIIEGYPVEPKSGNVSAPSIYLGTTSAFHKAGFTEAARRSATHPVMRRVIAA